MSVYSLQEGDDDGEEEEEVPTAALVQQDLMSDDEEEFLVGEEVRLVLIKLRILSILYLPSSLFSYMC